MTELYLLEITERCPSIQMSAWAMFWATYSCVRVWSEYSEWLNSAIEREIRRRKEAGY